ncbi:MAG TPA: DUF126 domain-containing protein [bacterium]|nr:DUF126 domain-containing protein [bacterium]
MNPIVLRGRKVVGGCAEGEALVTRDAISAWGGINPMTGTIIDTRYELRGQSFKGKVLVFPGAKGSSGWSTRFHIARLAGAAPVAHCLRFSGCAPELPVKDAAAPEAHLVHDALHRLPRDAAILMVEHDMDLVFRFVQEIVVLVQGRVLTRGTPAQIAADPRVRSVYLGRSLA